MLCVPACMKLALLLLWRQSKGHEDVDTHIFVCIGWCLHETVTLLRSYRVSSQPLYNQFKSVTRQYKEIDFHTQERETFPLFNYGVNFLNDFRCFLCICVRHTFCIFLTMIKMEFLNFKSSVPFIFEKYEKICFIFVFYDLKLPYLGQSKSRQETFIEKWKLLLCLR